MDDSHPLNSSSSDFKHSFNDPRHLRLNYNQSPLRRSILSSYEDRSPKFKASFINELESKQNSEIRKALDQLQEEERKNEASVDNLKAQITNIRRQIDATNQRHLAELQHFKQEYAKKTELYIRAAEDNIRRLQEALTDSEMAWEAEESEGLRLRDELRLNQLQYGEESAEMKAKVREMEQQLHQMKTQTCEVTRNEVERMRREVTTLQQFQENETRHLRQKFEASLSELSDTLESKEALLGNLNHELRDVQNQLQTLQSDFDAKHKSLKEALESSERLAELQRHEIDKLSLSGEQAAVEGTAKQRESSVLERKLEKLLSKNQTLHAEAARLGRLVYGKGMSR